MKRNFQPMLPTRGPLAKPDRRCSSATPRHVWYWKQVLKFTEGVHANVIIL